MLRDEYGMISPGRLLPIIEWLGWRKSLCDEGGRVRENRVHPFSLQVIQFPATQSHARAKFRFPQLFENIRHIPHQPMINRCEKL